MPLASKLALSADLMNGVITRMGKAVLGADETPSLTQAQKLREMVYRCAACSDQSGCAALQATVTQLDRPPMFCRNSRSLMALSKA